MRDPSHRQLKGTSVYLADGKRHAGLAGGRTHSREPNQSQVVPVGDTVAGTFDNVPVTAVAITDTNFHALAGPLTLTSVAVGGVYTGTITGGASNALVGQYFNTTGFTNAINNKAALHCLDWDHDHAAGRDHCGDSFGLRFERYSPARK